MKSRIRSRWHRANEKPLENGSSSTPQTAPMGEISPSNSAILTDDLSQYKPSENSSHLRAQNDHREGRKNNRNDGRKRNDNRRPGDNRPRKDNRHEKEDKSSNRNDSQKSHKRKSSKPRRNPSSKNRNGESSNSGSKSENRKKTSNHEKAKPSGLKGFLGKLFG